MKKDEEMISDKVAEKCSEVAKVIDGLKLPEVLAIVSTVVIELVYCARRDGIDVRSVVSGWLKDLANRVMKRDYSELDAVGGGELLN